MRLVAIAAALVSAACVPDQPTARPRPVAAAADLNAFENAVRIYRTRCAPCHGYAGRGDGSAAAQLVPPPRDFGAAEWQVSVTDRQIELAIVRGGEAIGRSPIMPANPDLAGRAEVVAALRAMLRGLGP